jgi:ABC-type sugar transport system ATPase subunit
MTTPTARDAILSVRDLSKSFPGVQALSDIELELARGEVHALLGENGAGKSTFVKIIAGVYRPDAGKISFDGRPRSFGSPADAFASGISVIHQETSLIPQLTVLENIFLGLEPTLGGIGLIDRRRLEADFHEVCTRLDFHLPAGKQARELSVAEQKMTEILKAMVHEASFIIMDEPTDSLTEAEIRHLFKIIGDLKGRGMTVLYITHYLEEVFEISDRSTILRDGRKVGTVHTREAGIEEVVHMMIGQEMLGSAGAPRGPAAAPRVEALRVQELSWRSMVEKVSFRAFRGEILGITGVLGAGKSELARLIFGAARPDEGRIYLEGQEVGIRTPVEAVARGIGMVPEDRKRQGLLLEMELYKNITLSALRGMTAGPLLSRDKELAACAAMVERLGIRVSGPFQRVKNLSGGNQQKVVIGKWLLAGLKVLILDEPTRGIDVGSKAEVHRIMRTLAEEGACILFISAEVPEIVQVSDRILIMRNGRLVAEHPRGVSQKEIMHILLEGSDS